MGVLVCWKFFWLASWLNIWIGRCGWDEQSDSVVSFAEKRETHHLQISYSVRKGTVCIFSTLVWKGHRYFTAKHLPYKPAKGLPTCWEFRGWMGVRVKQGMAKNRWFCCLTNHMLLWGLYTTGKIFVNTHQIIRSFLLKCKCGGSYEVDSREHLQNS